MMKRLIDIVLSLSILILLSPLLVIVYVLLKINNDSPVLFKQERIGRDSDLFNIYKFKTMTDRVDDSGILQSDSERMTILGKFLRKWSLDEIPSLINVIRGEMSLVGPRPLLKEYLDLYSVEQASRHNVKPGVTGWAQINGRNAISWDEKFKLDIWYVKNQSLILDLKIIVLTIIKVLKNENISQPGHATMEKFRGNN